MKTKVEIEGYEIEIEFVNGMISVKAEKDDEVVEEFSTALNTTTHFKSYNTTVQMHY